MYGLGEGVPQNYKEALKWYRRAADQGDAAAQFNLGLAYTQGKGVSKDYILAHMWLNLAASDMTGEYRKKAVETRDTVAIRMTPEQITEALRLAREWKPKKPQK